MHHERQRFQHLYLELAKIMASGLEASRCISALRLCSFAKRNILEILVPKNMNRNVSMLLYRAPSGYFRYASNGGGAKSAEKGLGSRKREAVRDSSWVRGWRAFATLLSVVLRRSIVRA